MKYLPFDPPTNEGMRASVLGIPDFENRGPKSTRRCFCVHFPACTYGEGNRRMASKEFLEEVQEEGMGRMPQNLERLEQD